MCCAGCVFTNNQRCACGPPATVCEVLAFAIDFWPKRRYTPPDYLKLSAGIATPNIGALGRAATRAMWSSSNWRSHLIGSTAATACVCVCVCVFVRAVSGRAGNGCGGQPFVGLACGPACVALWMWMWLQRDVRWLWRAPKTEWGKFNANGATETVLLISSSK